MFARTICPLCLTLAACLCAASPADAQWRSLYDQGIELKKQKKYPEAIRALERSVKLAVDEEGLETQIVAAVANEVGMTLDDVGNFAEAEKWYQLSLKAAVASIGEYTLDVGNTYNNLLVVYNNLGRYADAEKSGLSAIRVFERLFGPDSVQVAMAASNLGDAYRNQGKLDLAEKNKRRALAIRRTVLGDDNIEVGITLMGVGDLARERGRLDEAEQKLLKALQIVEAKSPGSLAAAKVWNSLGTTYRDQARFDAALTAIEKALAINRAHWGARHPQIALGANNLAAVYSDMGRLPEAETWQKLSYEIHRQTLGENHVDLAQDLSNLSGIYRQMGRVREATDCAFRGMAIYERALGPDHPALLGVLTQIGELLVQVRMFDQAEKVQRRLVALAEKLNGTEHPQVQLTVGNLGKMLYLAERNAEAEPHLRRAVELAEKLFPPDHPQLADSLTNLANLNLHQGRHADAEKLQRRAIGVYSKRLGAENLNTAKGLYNLVLVQGAQEDWTAAASTSDEAFRMLRKLMDQTLPSLGEREQLAFLEQNYQKDFRIGLGLAIESPGDAKIAALTAGWILNGKGVTQQVLAESVLLGRDAADPATRRAGNELAEIRRQLAQLVLGGAASDDGRQRVAELSAREQALAKQLGRRKGRDPWTDLEKVRGSIPHDAILVELIRLPNMDWKTQHFKPGERYVAWMIPPTGKGELQVVDLGDAQAIDAAVTQCRKSLGQAPQRILEDGEAEASKSLQADLAAASRLLLGPLEKRLNGYVHWIFSPDANLWLVPWGALSTSDGKYAVEGHVISYVVSGRDLVFDRTVEASGNAPLVLADPDFDKAGELSAGPAKTKSITRGPVRPFEQSWQRLPGTAVESKAIAGPLGEFAQRPATLLSGAAASEPALKNAYQPRVLVLATHGFFFDAPKLRQNSTDGPADVMSATATSVILENPLLRCGLALAGANQKPAARAGSDDGIVTGLEIVGLDLRGTELAVLSACETGLGDLRGGEGVAGLRHAFQLAGVRSVVASLWKVPDQETASLMADFWQRLAKGDDKAKALRGAQLSILESHRKQGRVGHPFYWAAFTLTGDAAAMTAGTERKRPEPVEDLVEAVVLSPTAEIMDGAKRLARLARGDRLSVLQRKGDWLLVRVPGDAKQNGWIQVKHVQVEE